MKETKQENDTPVTTNNKKIANNCFSHVKCFPKISNLKMSNNTSETSTIKTKENMFSSLSYECDSTQFKSKSTSNIGLDF